ncbi:MAG TPA: GNAT family N-acetyltransferase [Steroidobacteraceae bacterium]|jgi:GNAT superfamily N-acetyltransferase
MHPQDQVFVRVMKTLEEYPPGLIGTVTALFGSGIAASHGVDWTLEAMIAEKQCEFFRRFDPGRDRVWVAMEGDQPSGALTIEGPRPEVGEEAARLRFFILHPSLRGRGLGRRMLRDAMQFCRESGYRRVYLTTLPQLDAALHLYQEFGFTLVSQAPQSFHGSHHLEQVLQCNP